MARRCRWHGSCVLHRLDNPAATVLTAGLRVSVEVFAAPGTAVRRIRV